WYVLDASGKDGVRRGEMLARLVETALGRGLQVGRFLRLLRGERQLLDALAALREAEVVEDERMVGELLAAGDGGEVLEGPVEVAVGAFDEGKGEAETRRGGVLVAAELREELLEAVAREGVVLLVVGPAGGAHEHLGLLLGRHLGRQGEGG